ncbi:MAG: Bacterial alpha-L-rhamnosidase [Armatimonadetes bacterium]|nr:Bacterial alpha-L-rhamnosidase [Armatimonadota bacterium]
MPLSMILGVQLAALLSAPEATIRDYGLKPYIRLSKDLPHREDRPWKLVCEMPYNCQFQPWIQAEGDAGQEIRFNSTNPLVLYLTPTETTKTLAGMQTYEAKNWISGEGAMYTIPAGVTVKAVKYRETGYDTDFAGSFSCNDDDYNVLWRRAARTAYLCMRDHFYDCPDRERVGFWGDGTPELDQCFYVFDRRSDALCRNLVLRKLEPTFYPGQHLEFLGEYGLWFYYLQTGDLDSIRAAYEPTKTFLMETYKFGNRNTWFDWGHEPKDTAVIETCFAYIDLGTLRKMALVTGHEGDLPMIDAKLAEIRSTFDERFWNGRCYQSSGVAIPDDRANAMAVNAGLASRDKWASIYDNVLSNTTRSSSFFDRWVFEALCKMGLPDRALVRMASRYRTMIDSSFSTLWEHYDRFWATHLNDFDEGSSLNHGWNPPAIVLGHDIIGVRPVEPGWKVFEVMPQEAFLTSIKTEVPSIRGPVKVSISKTKSRYTLDLISPPGTTAVVGIPRASFTRLDSIEVGGKEAWKGAFFGGALGDGDEGGYVRFRVPAGHWTFVGKGSLSLASPKPPRVKPEAAKALDKHGWTVSASVPDGSFLFSGAKIPIDVSAANAIDGDHWTGWRDMTGTQHPGQWFQIDMGRRQAFDRVVLDNTWALFDYPRRYEVRVSDDGRTWSEPVASGEGHLGITRIAFPLRRARWIRVTQTGSDAKRNWSIYEVDVTLAGNRKP